MSLEDPLSFTSSSARQGLSTSVTVFDGGANVRTLQARRANYSGVEAQIESQRIQLEARVAREYYQAVRALRTIELEQALLASAQERLRRTEDLLRLAARNREDVLGARADVAQAEQNVERARGDADKTRLTLAATLGMQPTTSISVDTVLPPVFNPADLDVEALRGRLSPFDFAQPVDPLAALDFAVQGLWHGQVQTPQQMLDLGLVEEAPKTPGDVSRVVPWMPAVRLPGIEPGT